MTLFLFFVTGEGIFFTGRYSVCRHKVGSPGSASPSRLSCGGAEHALPPRWVCNSRLFHLKCENISKSLFRDESNFLTWQGRLKTMELVRSPCTGINGLVSSFVKLLQVGLNIAVSLFYVVEIYVKSSSTTAFRKMLPW